LIAWFGFYLVHGAIAALWFDGAAGDGPFQIFNPLRRIAAGQRPGADFQFYHGMGVPFLHYPIFAAFGKDLSASELSRQFTSLFAFVFCLATFVYAATRNLRTTVIVTAAATIVMEVFFPLIAGPGNSQIGVRSTLPVLAFAVMQTRLTQIAKAVLTGCCMGLAFLFGFEQGIALILSFSIISLTVLLLPLGSRKESNGLKLAGDRRANMIFALLTLASAVIVFVLGGMALCGARGFGKAVRFALVDLPMDKFWYDGTPPNPFLGTWPDLLKRHYLFPALPILVAALFLFLLLPRLLKGRVRLGWDWEPLAVIMLLYGVLSAVSLLGIYSTHYTIPVCRVLVLVTILVAANRASLVWKAIEPHKSARMIARAAPAVLACICAAAVLPLTYASVRDMQSLLRERRTATPEVSRFLSPRWDHFMAQATHLIDEHRTTPRVAGHEAGSSFLWSTYAGLLEAHYGIFNPSDDYLLLAVGSRRPQYLATFQKVKPEFVQTFTLQHSPYEEWLQNVNWAFYGEVLINYTLLGTVDHALLWRRKDDQWTSDSPQLSSAPVDRNCRCAVIPAGQGVGRIAVVKVAYEIHNPLQWFPLIGKTPRYFVIPEGSLRRLPISLPPYEPEFTFPIELRDDRPIKLTFETKSLLPGADFSVTRVQFNVLPWQSSHQAFIYQ